MKTITFIYEHTDGVRKSLDHVCVPFARANMMVMYAAGYRLTQIKHTNQNLVNEMRELWEIISGGAENACIRNQRAVTAQNQRD